MPEWLEDGKIEEMDFPFLTSDIKRPSDVIRDGAICVGCRFMRDGLKEKWGL